MKAIFKTIPFAMLAAGIFFLAGCSNAAGADTSVSSYSLGDKGPTGGTIVYVNKTAETDGWTYLEAAPEDLSNQYPFGLYNKNLQSYNLLTNVGNGKENTLKILDLSNNKNIAAYACDQFSLTAKKTGRTYKDWFLPSVSEFKQVCNVIGYSLPAKSYWTSSVSPTAKTSINSFIFLTNLKEHRFEARSKTHAVRPVRRF
jgi:hypothetical protein